MISDLQPYPRMRKSRAPWLGDLPAHWEVKPARALFAEVKDKNHPDAPMLSVTIAKGIIRQIELLAESSKKDSSNQDKSKYKLVQPGDVVYNKMRAWQGAVGCSAYEGIVSPAYIVQRPRGGVSARFMHYLLRTPQFAKEAERWSYGITSDQWSLRPEHFKMIYCCLPHQDEQAAIVKFLDHATRRIGNAIRAQQKLIKLLEEERQAIIHRAITRGLDPNVRLQPSGVEWMGDVPERWDLLRVKQAARILRGKFTFRPRNDSSLYDGPYPFIQTGDVARAGKAIGSFKQTLNERGLVVSRLFPAGTLVMTIAANIGDVAVLDFEACFPDSIVGFLPRAGVERDYLYYLFCAMKPELLREAPVNTQGNLNVDRIGAMRIALPPSGEQKDILQMIEKKTRAADAAIGHATHEITLIREYRTRLIADVVTGKVDVREAAKRLPEQMPEMEAADEAGTWADEESAESDDMDEAAVEEAEA